MEPEKYDKLIDTIAESVEAFDIAGALILPPGCTVETTPLSKLQNIIDAAGEYETEYDEEE